MRKFFISSHGHMASGLKSSLEILMGKADNVTVFDAYVNEDRVEDQVEAFFKTLEEGDQAILMSDLYGGSVNQVLYRYLDRPETYLIAGVNLGLVIELVVMSQMPVSIEDLRNAVEAAREGLQVRTLDDNTTAANDEEDFY